MKQNWIKRNSECTTIEDVFRSNTGYSKEMLEKVDKTEYKIKDFDKVKILIDNAVATNAPITVIGDYDCDGVCASVIMYHYFNSISYPVKIRLPRRFSEGYGLSEKIVDEIDSGLIITVDNGIMAQEAIKKAKNKGLTVIVTDHHMRGETLPDADVIVNPKAIENQADFDGYCGAGIAYKMVMYLSNFNNDLDTLTRPLAAIATVADMMPLIEDNRVIVKTGLSMLTERFDMQPKGFQAFLKAIYLKDAVEADDVGFKIAPCINASGRLLDNGAIIAFNLLKEDTLTTADRKDNVEYLLSLNEERKAIVENILNELDVKDEDNFIVAYVPEISLGVIGLMAGELKERFSKPCIVFSDADGDVLKGSGRSVDDINLKEMLDKCSELLLGYGGHSGAAGLAIKKGNLDAFKAKINEICPEIVVDTNIYYDLEITKDQVVLYADLQKFYAPYGEKNPKIRYLIKDYTLEAGYGGYYSVMGKNANHIKLFGGNSSAVGFDFANEYKTMGEPTHLDIVGTLSERIYRGKNDVQIEIADLSKTDKKKGNTCFVLNF